MSDTVGQINQLSTIPNPAGLAVGRIPVTSMAEVPTKWRLKGLLISTGQWVNIETYPDEIRAKDALSAARTRSTFSDKVHIRDHEAFAVFAIEPAATFQYLGGVLRN